VKLGGGKSWYTAAELADLGLPGLPGTKRKINERAAAECWALATAANGTALARQRAARGGGLEYHVDLLPAAARSALADKGVAPIADVHVAPDTKSAQMWRWFDGLSDKDKAEAERRLQIIVLLESYEAAGMTRSAAITAIAGAGQAGASTLWAWLRDIDGIAPSNRLPFLAPKRAGGGAAADIDGEAWQFLLSDYLRPEKPTFSSCYERLRRDYATPRGLKLPTERTLRRKLERDVDGRLIIARREGAEAVRRTLPSQQRSVAELHALEAINIDGHKFDVFVRHDDGRVGRVVMVAIQDIYSRKILAWRIGESESALLTRLAFADLFGRWGIPRHAVLDNGRAFASKWITGGAKSRFRFKIKDDEPTGVLTALGVQIHWATPYRGQSKPIERAFRDLCDTIAKHPKLAGCYTGNKPDAKPENYGSAAVPIGLFRELVTAGIAAHNARGKRRTEMARGIHSFDDVFAASYAAAPIGKATPEQLRIALLTAEDRMCDRRTAEITLEGNRYFTPELWDHAGKRLTVRFDPDDLHGAIHVYARDGSFIATAPAIAATGFFDKASAVQRRAQERDLRRRVREAAEIEQLLDAEQIAAMLPDHIDETPVPGPSVVRPVRHRATAAALAVKPEQEASHAPLTPVIDRFIGLRLV
jgi:putative transposase